MRLGACSNDAGAHPSGCIADVPPPRDSGAAGAGGASDVDGGSVPGSGGSGCSCRTSSRGADGEGVAWGLAVLFSLWRRARHSMETSSSSYTRSPAGTPRRCGASP
jgi:MYXO-CTERM domain-containing protein